MPPKQAKKVAVVAEAKENAGATTAGELPLLPGMPSQFKAFTTMRVPGGWACLELTLDKDLNVINVEASTPDMKAHIQEKFKIRVGKYWMKLGD